MTKVVFSSLLANVAGLRQACGLALLVTVSHRFESRRL